MRVAITGQHTNSITSRTITPIPFLPLSLVKYIEKYEYSVGVYQKYLTRLGELIIFEPWRENYHFSQPS